MSHPAERARVLNILIAGFSHIIFVYIFVEEMSEIWLAAHADPVANVHTFQSCMTLANVYGQPNHQCVIADNGNLTWPPKLKVWKP